MKVYEINDDLAGLVPMASPTEQEALTSDILLNGQLEPIVLWQGKVVDGRCRQVACMTLGIDPIVRNLDWNTRYEDVADVVKSLNTRRNLTLTQKIVSACRQSNKVGSKKVYEIAKSWGISDKILKNCRYIAKHRPEFIGPLFNGKSVTITSSDGMEVESNKITTIYASIKRYEEVEVTEDVQHGWVEDSYIKTQKGKDWYNKQIKGGVSVSDVKVRMLLAELANYKFSKIEVIDG